QLNITSGGLVTAANFFSTATGSISFDGGTLQLTSTSSTKNAINFLAGGGTLDLPNANTALTVTSSVSGPGRFHKTGPGKPILSLSPLSAPDPSIFGPDKTFLIVANDAPDPITGAFGSITGLPPGYAATLDYAYTGTDALGRTADGNDIALTLTAVPEPSELV